MLQNDRKITISAAGTRKATQWPAQALYWSELVEKLRVPARGTESLAEYMALPKSKQDDLKDVGGFVAGTLQGNRRKAASVLSRDIITLDLDNMQPGSTEAMLRVFGALGCAYVVYSTRKHDAARPRLRLLVPTDRTVSVDEYEPLARKLASFLGIEQCDPTTFEASRLMYWPSCCSDSQYVYQIGDAPFLNADAMLAKYANWRDVSEWPTVPGIDKAQQKRAAQQGDPTTKNGIVGAFCKLFDVYRAMEELLPGVYEPCDDGRYTFTGGSTVGGAVVYDQGRFLFSHHATDPTSGKLVNAFDLVRLHLFGDKDDEAKDGTPTNKLPSYTAMCEYAVQDTAVAAILNQERYEKATQAFAQPMLPAEDETANWIHLLAVNGKGMPLRTVDNALIILEQDPFIKGKLAYDDFADKGMVLGALPWEPDSKRRQWCGADDQGILHYLEKVHSLQLSENKIAAAVGICARKNRFNAVREYLEGLQWDGVRRVDGLLVDYLGALDSPYVQAVMRKSLTAAVARVMEPGCKYDYMPIFSGPQGIGKSTFLLKLGRSWYSDSLQTFEGKDACELIQGTWLNEVGELNGMSRVEINAVKQFLSRREDLYRAAYGRHTEAHPRRCVFFGTTNDAEFLRDRTGNRRFWPVDVGLQLATKSIFQQLDEEVEQIWAEAFMYWRAGEPLYMTGELAEAARKAQEEHQECNTKEGIILEFLERPIPVDWNKRSLNDRRLYWSGAFGTDNVDTLPRKKVCAAEIWAEAFGCELKYIKQTDTREINGILSNLPGWERCNSTIQIGGPYKHQRGFVKH